MIRNKEVARMWANNKSGKSKSMSTDGNNLYSYKLMIGKTINNKKIVYNYITNGIDFVSQTTSKHVGHAKQYADKLVNLTEIEELK